MSYTILQDFKKLIQTDNLAAIIGNDYTLVDQVSASSRTEIISYLAQKYDVSREFADLAPWDPTVAYKALSRVYLDASDYIPGNTYNINDLALHSGSVYVCISDHVTGTWDGASWAKLGPRYAMFFVTLPAPDFSFDSIYKKSDPVWWNDSTYECQIETILLSHDTQINYPNYKSIPPINIAPDDISAGLKYWGSGTAYSAAAGTLPTDASKWTAGDSRNPQLVNTVIDVALYTIHSRIAPRNIPDLRVKRYDDAIKWLKDIASGKFITAALPVIKPSRGSRIRWGSDVRKNTQY